MNSTSHELIVTDAKLQRDNAIPLAEQRKALRQKIRTHRLVLEQQLGPDEEQEESRAYPRSMIMRFLADRPGLATAVLGKLATFFVGARLFKSSGTALAVAGIVRSMLAKR